MRKLLAGLILLVLIGTAACERPAVNFRRGDVIVLSDGEHHLTEPELLLGHHAGCNTGRRTHRTDVSEQIGAHKSDIERFSAAH